MWIDKALPYGADILLSAYAVYLFFYYFDIFFARKKSKKLWVAGLTEFVLWQFGISTIISLPAYVNIAVTVIVTLFAVTITYEGMWWNKCVFVITFNAIWMLMETLSNYVLMIYCEQYASIQPIGSFVSKSFFLAVIIALKKVFTDDEIKEFYDILCENLSKYDTKPVHSLAELLDFKNDRFPKECGFFGIFKEDEMLAGSMMFYFDKVGCAHTQYLAARQAFNKLSPMTFMYYSMIVEMKNRGYKRISWGTATEDLGNYLNMGLITSKEDFGSSYCNNLTYSITL